MGSLLAKLYDEPSRVLLLGLDEAGKTKFIYQAKLKENVSTSPTIGSNIETVSPVKGVTLTVWDMGGQPKLRPIWRFYFSITKGLLFIVDSSDVSRMSEAKEELYRIIEHENMCGVPVVVVANKQDLPGALSTAEVADKLGLHEMQDRKWRVQGACATTGDGIDEAMQEMAKLVIEYNKQEIIYN